MFAHYNQWSNRRIYDAAATLGDSDYRADRGVFFKSMQGTLNHLLVTDKIWLNRLSPAAAAFGPAPQKLDAILFANFTELRTEREAQDMRIVEFVAGLSQAALISTVLYRRVSSPEQIEQAVAPALAHWFNHQTHHRGQAHAVLTSLGKAAPELDLLYFQRLTKSDSGTISSPNKS